MKKLQNVCVCVCTCLMHTKACRLSCLECINFNFLVLISSHDVSLHAQSFSHIQLLGTPWIVACQVPLSVKFTKQKYCSGWPYPTVGDFLTQGSKLCLLHWHVDSLPLCPLRSPYYSDARY